MKALNAILAVVLSTITFFVGKEYFPRVIDRPVIVEKEVKVPVEVKVEVPVIKEVIKEVPVKLTPEQSDAILAYNLVNAASKYVPGPSDTNVLPEHDGKQHPELSVTPSIWIGSDKIRVFITLDGRADEPCNVDAIYAMISRRLQEVGLECELGSNDLMKAMFQSPNAISVQVRLMETSQYAYAGTVSTSFHQTAIGMNSHANPAVGPWKKFRITPVEEEILIRAGKTAAPGYIMERIDTQLIKVCASISRGLKK